jgi:lipopolysaccharide biosynthesis glycosyltransferase
MLPIKVCIGTEPKTKIAEYVLRFSITRHTQSKVEFVSLIGKEWEAPKGLHQGTGFSLRRWMIPKYFNYSGRAIYLDADQLVLSDLSELWNKPETQPSKNVSVWVTYQPDSIKPKPWPQTSVMVIDCEAAKTQWQPELLWQLLKNGYDYQKFMHGSWLKPQPIDIDKNWNALDRHTADTKLIHFTREPEQPWYNPGHKLAGIWQAELAAAIQSNAVPKNEFVEALSKWGIKLDWRPTNGLHPYYKRFLSFFK